MFPSSVNKFDGGGSEKLGHISGDVVKLEASARPPLAHTVRIDGEEKELLFTSWQNMSMKVELTEVKMMDAILGTSTSYFKREADIIIGNVSPPSGELRLPWPRFADTTVTRPTSLPRSSLRSHVSQEKMASFILSVYLMSTLSGTLFECLNFLVIDSVFSACPADSFWLVLGCWVEVISVILIMIATQLLFLDSPAIADQLLNCVALNFLCEVDNSMVGLIQRTAIVPGLGQYHARSMAVLNHFTENWEGSAEREALHAAYHEDYEENKCWRAKKDGGDKKMGKQKISKRGVLFSGRCMKFFNYFYCVLLVLLWLTTSVGTVCMSSAQLSH
mmetsp:Transcript_27583/g.75058  ORF Transcript_27583/g.75058 Transcript_27583/m.75058 type:complete len:332 (-) Transcript_27583:222-1217(-)